MDKRLIYFLLALLSSSISQVFADQDLKEKIIKRTEDFEGQVGIYIHHFKTNSVVEIQSDSLFPTASLIKIPIMINMFDKMEKGNLSYQDTLLWFADSVNYPADDGILCAFQDGKKIVLSKIISLMITYSDNHASLWCQKLSGGGEGINRWLQANGFKKTRVNLRTKGRLANWKKYGWGQTTPKEMAQLLVMIREGSAVSSSASEEMYRILTNIYWDGEALAPLPPEIQVASKQGAVSKSRSEVVFVNAPSGDYVFCIITNDQEDTSWDHENAGYVLLRDISKIIWKHFEPEYPWIASPGRENYYK
jgi:beta-lactamase class A